MKKSDGIEPIAIGSINSLSVEQEDDLSIEVMTQVCVCFSVSGAGMLQVHSLPSCEVIWKEPLLPHLLDEIEYGECDDLLEALQKAIDAATKGVNNE
jgi:hypothetical protein